MTRYLLPAFMIVLFIAIMLGINSGLWWITSLMSTDAIFGFLAGCLFCAALYFVIQWLEPSRPNR